MNWTSLRTALHLCTPFQHTAVSQLTNKVEKVDAGKNNFLTKPKKKLDIDEALTGLKREGGNLEARKDEEKKKKPQSDKGTHTNLNLRLHIDMHSHTNPNWQVRQDEMPLNTP